MPRRRWSFHMEAIDHAHIRVLDDLYRGRLTPTGRAVFWGALAAGIFLLGGLSAGGASYFGFFGGVMLTAALAGLRFRPRVRVTRQLPPPGAAGETWAYHVTVENTGSALLRDVMIEERGLPSELRPVEEPPVIAELAPGERATVRLRLLCRMRGAYRLRRLQVSTAAPSGLLKGGPRLPVEDRVLVYPRFERLERFEVPVGRTHQPGGVPAAAKVGESAELHSLRAWREGDRLRDVHWPSFARHGRLVVREFQEEYFARVALVVDLCPAGRLSAIEAERQVERALSAAAAITDALARQDYLVDIFAAGDRVQRFTTGLTLDHMEHVLELLACLEVGDRLDAAALEAVLVPESARLSVVVFVLTAWDPGWAALVGQVRGLGIAVRVVLAGKAAIVPEELGPDEHVVLG